MRPGDVLGPYQINSKWLPPDVVEISVEGLRMAGLGE